MSKITRSKTEVNCETGIVRILPLTQPEIADMQAKRIEAETNRLNYEAKESTKRATKQSALDKLATLGLTADEIAALSK